MTIYEEQNVAMKNMLITERCTVVKAKWRHEFLTDEWCSYEDRDLRLIEQLAEIGYDMYGEKVVV